MKEFWKNILRYEGLYQASNLGRIKRLFNFGCKKERILSPSNDGYGYLQIGLCKNNIRKNFKVHRLILETFVGPRPDKMECLHIDGNSKNNNLNNLKYGTHKENMKNSVEQGNHWFSNNKHLRYQPDVKGIKNGQARLNELQVRIIKKLLETNNLTQIEIAKIFNITQTTISKIKNNKSWKN